MSGKEPRWLMRTGESNEGFYTNGKMYPVVRVLNDGYWFLTDRGKYEMVDKSEIGKDWEVFYEYSNPEEVML